MNGKIISETDLTVSIKVDCKCGYTDTYVLDKQAYNRWINGQLIQNVFPELSANDREMLISGHCSKCWQELFDKGFEEELNKIKQ